MGMIQREQDEADIEIKFAEIEDQCDRWRERGYKILVAYQPITSNSVATDFYKSMLSVFSGEVWTHMADVHKVIIKPYVSAHFPIDANRNMAVLDAKKRYKADYIFFMDTDQTFPPLTIPTLYEALLQKQKAHKKCVMAGMYFSKKDPWSGIFGNYAPWDEKSLKHKKEFRQHKLLHNDQQLLWWKYIAFWSKGQIFPVDVIGAGCMMMSLSLFDGLEMPYFKYVPDFANPGKTASEDMWFCASLKKRDIPIFINSNVSCGHLTQLACDVSLYTNQRDGFYTYATQEKAREVYPKQIDVRSEEEKQVWKSKVLGEDRGDE